MTEGNEAFDASVAPALRNSQKKRENRRISENPLITQNGIEMS